MKLYTLSLATAVAMACAATAADPERLLLLGAPGLANPDGEPSPRAQEEPERPPDRRADGGGDERREPRGRGGPFPGFDGGPGGFGRTIELVEKFDTDGDGLLDAEERKAARAHLASERQAGRGGRRFGPRRRGFGNSAEAPRPGEKVAVDEVPRYPDAALYDPSVLRTFFLEFESDDWEKELADFNNTDVEVPARLTVDGKTYENVGIHFRGMSSFMMVGEGRKRSLNLSLDFIHKTQRLYGYRTLNLLNCHVDPSFLHTVLFSHIARQYLPAPRANFVRVVINGESWGVYVNAQQFNKDLVRDWFATGKGARWKAPGNPRGRASLAYLGDEVDDYRPIYSIRSKDRPESWAALIKLCKLLEETPAQELEKTLEPILDIDGALRFLALENVFVNMDGYWVRTSDYNLYLDVEGRFHIIPHDADETFGTGEGGPGGFPGGFPGGGFAFGGFGRGMTAARMLVQGDTNDDGRLSKDEIAALVGRWFDIMDKEKTGKLDEQKFVSSLGDALFPADDKKARRPEGPVPDGFIAAGMFAAADPDRDGSVNRSDFTEAFGTWFDSWDEDERGVIDEPTLANGLRTAFPRPEFPGFGPGAGGRGGRARPPSEEEPREGDREDRERARADGDGADERRGDRGGNRRDRRPGAGGGRRGGRGRGPGGVRLDPLFGADDEGKPLLSKLLEVPALRERYLGYVREIAETWLDWERIGPIARRHHALIADHVRADTRKIGSIEAFEGAIDESGEGRANLKAFLDKRRAYLLERLEGIAAGGKKKGAGDDTRKERSF